MVKQTSPMQRVAFESSYPFLKPANFFGGLFAL